jgi:BMFP domain-containing protein YqiC
MNLGAIMTMPIRIDTLKYAQLLKESGLSAEQAELQAEALGTVLNECHVAVESDLVIQRSDLLARMDLLQQELYDRMDLLRQEVFDRMDLLKQETFSKIHEVELALSIRLDALERRMAGIETRFYWLFGIQFVVDAVILFKLFA